MSGHPKPYAASIARRRRGRIRPAGRSLPWGTVFPVAGIVAILVVAGMQETIAGLIFCGICLIGSIAILVAVRKP